MKKSGVMKIGIMVLFASTFAASEEQSETFKGNSQRNETVVRSFPEQLVEGWRHQLPTEVTSSPIVVRNQLLVGGLNGVLYAFNLSDRRIAWTLATQGSIRATPSTDRSRGYVLSEDGYFYAFDLKSGEIAWRFKTQGEQRFAAYGFSGVNDTKPVIDPWDYFSSSAIIADDIVIFGSGDSHIYAVDRSSGELKWAYKTGGVVHSSPSRWKGNVIVGSWDSNLYALDIATGKLVWKFHTGSEQQMNIWRGIQASPAIFDDNVYIGSRDGFLYSIDAESGNPNWRFDMSRSWVLTTVAVDNEQVYVGSSDTGLAIALNRHNGTENWRFNTEGWNYSSPLLFEDSVLFSSMLGNVIALDKISGKPVWQKKLGAYHHDTYRVLEKDNTNGTWQDALYGRMSRLLASGGFAGTAAWYKNQLIMISNAGEIYLWQAGPEKDRPKN